PGSPAARDRPARPPGRPVRGRPRGAAWRRVPGARLAEASCPVCRKGPATRESITAARNWRARIPRDPQFLHAGYDGRDGAAAGGTLLGLPLGAAGGERAGRRLLPRPPGGDRPPLTADPPAA